MKNLSHHTPQHRDRLSRLSHLGKYVSGAVTALGILASPVSGQVAHNELITTTQSTNQALLRNINTLERSIEILWTSIGEISGKPTKIRDRFGNVTPEALNWIESELAKKFRDVTQELQTAQDKLTETGKNTDTESAELQKTKDLLASSLTEIENLKKILEEKNTTLSLSSDESVRKIEKITSEIDALKTSLSNTQKENAALIDQIRSLESDKEALQGTSQIPTEEYKLLQKYNQGAIIVASLLTLLGLLGYYKSSRNAKALIKLQKGLSGLSVLATKPAPDFPPQLMALLQSMARRTIDANTDNSLPAPITPPATYSEAEILALLEAASGGTTSVVSTTNATQQDEVATSGISSQGDGAIVVSNTVETQHDLKAIILEAINKPNPDIVYEITKKDGEKVYFVLEKQGETSYGIISGGTYDIQTDDDELKFVYQDANISINWNAIQNLRKFQSKRESIKKYPYDGNQSPLIGIHQWFISQFDLSDDELKKGEKLLITTNVSMIIVEVITPKSFKILGCSPRSPLSAGTILGEFDLNRKMSGLDETIANVTSLKAVEEVVYEPLGDVGSMSIDAVTAEITKRRNWIAKTSDPKTTEHLRSDLGILMEKMKSFKKRNPFT